MAAIGMTKVKTVVYPTMRHETLNETERGGAMREFADWCLKTIADTRT